jgi:hypothetical protein
MFPRVAEKPVRGALSISRENGKAAEDHNAPPDAVKGHRMTPPRAGADVLPLRPVRADPFPGISEHDRFTRRGGGSETTEESGVIVLEDHGGTCAGFGTENRDLSPDRSVPFPGIAKANPT